MAEALERDVVVGSTAAQKVPPGGAVTECRDCQKACLLGDKDIRELGRRPAAVVLCDVCNSMALLKQSAKTPDEQLVKALQGASHDGLPKKMLDAIDQLAKSVAPYELRSHLDFDPPEAGELIEKTRTELADRYRWSWTNDTGTTVLITQRVVEPNGLPRQYAVTNKDVFTIEVPKPEALGFPAAKGWKAPRRPVRDNPQA